MAAKEYDVLRDLYTDPQTLVKGGQGTVELERDQALPLLADGVVGPMGTIKARRDAEAARREALAMQAEAEAEVRAAEDGVRESIETERQEAVEEVTPSQAPEASANATKKAAELGVDLAQVTPTGASGQITVTDVEQHAQAELVRKEGV